MQEELGKIVIPLLKWYRENKPDPALAGSKQCLLYMGF